MADPARLAGSPAGADATPWPAASANALLRAWLADTEEAVAIVAADSIGLPVIAASPAWARYDDESPASVVGRPCRALLRLQAELEPGVRLCELVRAKGSLKHRLLDRSARGRPFWSTLTLTAVESGALFLVTRKLIGQEPGHEADLDHYGQAANGGGHGLWSWDLVTGDVWYSPATKTLLGYGNDEEFPETFDSFYGHVLAEDRPIILRAVRRHLEQRRALDLECRVQSRDGTLRWLELRGNATRDPGGHPIRLSGSLLDITQRRQAEETTRYSGDLQRRALDALTISVAVLNGRGEIVETNRSWREFAGSGRLAGAGFDFGEDYALLCEQASAPGAAAAQGIRAVLDGTRASFAITYDVTAPDGKRHYELRVQPFLEGESRGAIVIHMDVSATRDAYARLADSRDFYELLLNSIPIMIAYVAQDGRIQYLNRSSEAWFRLPLSALRGRRFEECVLPQHAREVSARMDAVLHRARDMEFEVSALRADGERRDLAVNYVAHRDAGGAVAGFVSVARDVTEQKVLEATLRQAQKMETVGQLTGGIAHDFNNLLSVIIGNLQLLERPLVARDERLAKQVQTALRAALRGSDLTRRLLAFARQTALEPRPVNVSTLVQGMIELLRRSLGRDVEIHLDLLADPWTVRADPAQLENCILNLAINARDAMPRGGSLVIETRNVVVDGDLARRHPQLRAGDYLAVAVTDSGCGMAPDVARKAFDPFFTTKEVGKGTGLGLSMVYGFLEQSGGLAVLHSEVGAGTTIRLHFPRVEGQAASPRDVETSSGTPMPCGHERVLVVEDDSDVRATAVGALKSLGYTVLEAATASQALEIIQADGAVQLLFTDVTLPGGMHGPDLARRAHVLLPDMKVLFTSGFSESAIIHRGILDGTLPLVPKPYSIADLARRVRATLERS